MGDALGMPVEFLTPEQIEENFGFVLGIVQALEWHPHSRLKSGSVSDDTRQALAIAHAYTEDGRLTAEAVSVELLKWADSIPAGELEVLIGPSTRRSLELIKQGGDVNETGSQGTTNGAAMRVAPVGLINNGNYETILNDAVQASLPTHGSNIAISGSAAVAFAVAQALEPQATIEMILDAAKTGAARGRSTGKWHWGTPLEGRIDLAQTIVSNANNEKEALRDLYRFVGVDVLVAESVATAFGIVHLANGDPMQAIWYGVNIGGDTDTIAAIAGAICGAWKGIQAIDRTLLASIEQINGLDLSHEARRLYGIMERKRSQGMVKDHA